MEGVGGWTRKHQAGYLCVPIAPRKAISALHKNEHFDPPGDKLRDQLVVDGVVVKLSERPVRRLVKLREAPHPLVLRRVLGGLGGALLECLELSLNTLLTVDGRATPIRLRVDLVPAGG